MSAEQAHIGTEGRRFIRHPTTIPIHCRKEGHVDAQHHELRDISHGGLSFVSNEAYAPGDIIGIDFPSLKYRSSLRGEIVWSSPLQDISCGGRYLHGMRFLGERDHYHARLIEQVCRIECYRRAQSELYGRHLSSREAAQEWIARHADRFPD